MQAIHTYPSSPSGRTWVQAPASLTLFPLFRPEALASLTLKVVAYWKIKTKTKTNKKPSSRSQRSRIDAFVPSPGLQKPFVKNRDFSGQDCTLTWRLVYLPLVVH